MKKVIYSLRICLLLLFLQPAWYNYALAQSYPFTHYQVENGLSNNAVLCSLQDKNGFLWFGTKDGLNRFDGYSFKIFRNEPSSPESIGNNVIYCLYQDKQGILWVGTDRGIYRYNERLESFTYLKAGADSEIRDIKEDNSGNLWFITGNVLNRYNKKTGHLVTYNRQGINAVSLAFIDGTLWAATTARYIYKYNPASNSFTAFDVFAHSKPATAYWIQKLYDAGNGKMLIGTSNQGVKLFDTITGAYKDVLTYNEDKTEIFARNFIKEADNEYWIATESGIYIYNLKSGKSTLLHKQYNSPYSISDNAVYTFCKDKEGGIWAGTYFGGLNYYARQYTYFEKFFPKVGENSLSGNAVREICPGINGDIWIGTEDAGLNKFNPKTEYFTNYKPLGKPTDISTSNIHGLLTYNNTLLIGTFEHGLDVMDIKTEKIKSHYTVFTDTNLKSNFFYTLYRTHTGRVITATSRGLYYYQGQLPHFTRIKQVPPDIFYTSVTEDSNGNIWAGTYREGLFYFNPHTSATGAFNYRANDTTSLSNNKINSFFEDSNHNLWIATENGLCRFNSKRRNFKRYTTDTGLPSNVIYAILEDSKKHLWISTSKGLASINLLSGMIKVYTRANGLLSDQFNYNSAYKDAQGNMYFGCVKGMIKFNPDSFTTNTFQAPVYITGFQVNNKELDINNDGSPLKKSISYTDTIKLAYNQSSFSIDFAALSYTSPQTASYAYQLTGLDKDWVYLKGNRKVYFTRLSPGSYTFRVKASENGSLWSTHQAQLTIIISPPFWASLYAYLFYAALFITGVYALVRNYHNRTQEKNRRKIEVLENEKEREIYQAKIAFFTHVAHEIRTPLTLIVGPMEKVMQKAALVPEVKKNLATMERNTQRLLTLTNQLLDFSKTEIHGFSLNFVKTDVTLLIRDNIMRFADAAQQKKIQIKPAIEATHFYAYVDSEALNKVLSNLLDNAVKYAAAKVYIQLTVNADNNTFTILIKSDGSVIPPEMKEKIFESFFRMKEAERQSGTGIGLPLARYLAELHKGTLVLSPATDNLNVFALTLPIHQEIEFNI